MKWKWASAAAAALLAIVSAPAQIGPVAAIQRKRIQPATSDGTVILVVDEDAEPIPGADVVVIATQAAKSKALRSLQRYVLRAHRGAEPWNTVHLAARIGIRYQTGTDGTVTVKLDGPSKLVAIHNWEFGIRRLSPDTAEAEIRVAAPSTVVARVLDTEGRPVRGVPLARFAHDEGC